MDGAHEGGEIMCHHGKFLQALHIHEDLGNVAVVKMLQVHGWILDGRPRTVGERVSLPEEAP